MIGYIMGLILVLITVIELLRVVIVAIRKKKRGAGILSIGFGYLVFFSFYLPRDDLEVVEILIFKEGLDSGEIIFNLVYFSNH